MIAGAPQSRPGRPLTVEAIIGAAIHLADHDGLSAVSIRRVATALAARPMSLYSFIDSKDDLVARMLDAALGDLVLDSVPDGWRAALQAIARRTVEVGTRHPWIVAASVQSTAPGPNALAHAQQTLEALGRLGVDEDRARGLAAAIDMYTIGFAAVTRGGAVAASHDRVFTQGFNWLLDGFEGELTGATAAP